MAARRATRSMLSAAPPPEMETPARAGNSAGVEGSCDSTGCIDDKANQRQPQVVSSGLAARLVANPLDR